MRGGRAGGVATDEASDAAARQLAHGRLSDGPAVEMTLTPESLYVGHHLTLIRTAALMTDDRGLAEEIVHDAFAEVIARWSTIDPTKALGYLYRAVTNGCRSNLRRRRTARAFVPDRPTPEQGADEPVLQAAGYELIFKAVRHLPPRQRQVLVLRYYSELSVAETADALNISEGAVAVATHHALNSLRSLREELS